MIFLLFIPNHLYALEKTYLFIIDENDRPIKGYRVLATTSDDIFWGQLEILKKWIFHTKSELYVLKEGKLFRVKDSQIKDKKSGVVLFFIDYSDQKALTFNISDVSIDRDSILLSKIHRDLFSGLPKTLSKEQKKDEIDPLILASNYEAEGNRNRAIIYYEEALKRDPASTFIMNKLFYLYYSIGDFNNAKRFLERLPKDEDKIAKMASLLLIEGNFKKALEVLNGEEIDKSAYLKYLKGIAYYLTGNRDGAYKIVLELSEKNKELSQSLRDLLR